MRFRSKITILLLSLSLISSVSIGSVIYFYGKIPLKDGKWVYSQWNIILGMGALILLGTLFIAWKASKSIVKPVLRMADAANQIAQGDLDARIDYVFDDEFSTLAGSFNKMTRDLKARRMELLAEKAYINSVFNAAGESIIVINPEGVVEAFNRMAEETFGYRAEEVVNKNITMLMPLPYRKKHSAGIANYNRTGKSKVIGKGHIELEGLKKDGTTFPLDLTVTEVILPDTNRRIFVGMIRDITERKHFEKEIESTARFPDESPHQVLRLAADGTVLYANRASFSLLHAWEWTIGGKVKDYWCKIVQEVLKDGKNREMEVVCDDQVLSLTFVPLVDFGYVNIYGMDITDRKRINSELRESEARVSSIVKAAVDGIITVDETGIVQLFNPAASKIFGYEPEEVIGKDVRMLMASKTDRSQYEEYFSHYLKAGEDQIVGGSQDVLGRHKNGDIIPLDLSLSEMIMANGQRLFIGIIRDITERKRAEEEIKKAMAAKDDFTSMVSHELRTPLAISKEALSLILRKKVGVISAQQEEVVKMASANIDRLGYLINDILDETKVSAGKMVLAKEMLNIIDLVKENLNGWKLQAETKHIECSLNVPKKTLIMFIDAIRFMQILSNLISNAIKFTPEFGKVSVTVEEMADAVKFIVQDSGIGIAQEDIPKIFLKFHQLKRTYGPGMQGTGLGLNITKSLIELHGGQIFVESKVGEGTTFAFTIPKKNKEGKC